MSKTAAVTGATGFLGAHLCERLLADGWEVHGLSRPSSDRGDLEGSLEWYVGDLFDEGTLRELVDGADAVFHLAGIGLWSGDDETVERVNEEGTRKLLEACREPNVDAGRLVFTSTAGTRRPPEDGEPADESDVARPVGAYQSSKAAAEVLVDNYAGTAGEAVTVHPTSIFGPGDETFTAQLLAMATSPTMPVYLPGGLSIVGVDDVVEGIIAAYERGGNGEHYILGGENLTLEQAISRIAHCTGGTRAPVQVPATAIRAAGPVAETVGAVSGVRIFPFDRDMARLATKRLYYSSSKAQSELGYSYDSLEDHVPDAMEWYRSL